MSNFSHQDLIEIGRNWCLRSWRPRKSKKKPRVVDSHGECSLVITDMTSSVSETPDVIAWDHGSSILLEAKVSRADFLADKKKGFRRRPTTGVGTRRYFITPVGLLAVPDLPTGWGLIEVNPQGKTRVLQSSLKFKPNLDAENKMLLSLILRLDVNPGQHITIRAYKIPSQGVPRATVTFRK